MLRKYIQFVTDVVGNGTDSTVVIDLSTDPILFVPPQAPAATQLSPFFDLTESLPSWVGGLSSTFTIASSSYDALLGQITVTFSSPPSSGSMGYVTGNLEYA